MSKIKKLKRYTCRISESFILEILGSAKLMHKQGFDIKLQDLHFEVKGAKPHINNGFLFHIHKHQPRWGDIIALVCLDKANNPERLFLLPRKTVVGKKHIWIGPKTIKHWGQWEI